MGSPRRAAGATQGLSTRCRWLWAVPVATGLLVGPASGALAADGFEAPPWAVGDHEATVERVAFTLTPDDAVGLDDTGPDTASFSVTESSSHGTATFSFVSGFDSDTGQPGFCDDATVIWDGRLRPTQDPAFAGIPGVGDVDATYEISSGRCADRRSETIEGSVLLVFAVEAGHGWINGTFSHDGISIAEFTVDVGAVSSDGRGTAAGGGRPSDGSASGGDDEGLDPAMMALVAGLVLAVLVGLGVVGAGLFGGGATTATAGGGAAAARPFTPADLGLPDDDPLGRPVIIQNGQFGGGGTPGQVWWGGQWVDASVVRDSIGRHVATRDVQITQFQSDSATAAQDGRVRADALDAQHDAQRLQGVDDQVRGWQRADRRDDLARWQPVWQQQSANAVTQGNRLQAIETAATAVSWVADRSVDVLAYVTGPPGKSVKNAYTVTRRLGVGAVETWRTGDPTRMSARAIEAAIDLRFGDVTSKGPLASAMFGPKPSSPITHRALADASVSTVSRLVRTPGTWVRHHVADGVHAAADGWARGAAFRDPVKNVIDAFDPARGHGATYGQRVAGNLTDPRLVRPRDPLADRLVPDLSRLRSFGR